jgi:hypothetical protein
MDTFVIPRRNKLPKYRLPTGVIFKYNKKEQMTEKHMGKWLIEPWGRQISSLTKKLGLLAFYAFKSL